MTQPAKKYDESNFSTGIFERVDPKTPPEQINDPELKAWVSFVNKKKTPAQPQPQEQRSAA